jgi:hypothetical protein
MQLWQVVGSDEQPSPMWHAAEVHMIASLHD